MVQIMKVKKTQHSMENNSEKDSETEKALFVKYQTANSKQQIEVNMSLINLNLN